MEQIETCGLPSFKDLLVATQNLLSVTSQILCMLQRKESVSGIPPKAKTVTSESQAVLYYCLASRSTYRVC